jgi:hypothetical protein
LHLYRGTSVEKKDDSVPMTTNPQPDQRLGLHYFPDSFHYRQVDMHAWLPELKSLGISWLTLYAPADRAIPEDFIIGLIDAGIEPILHFALPMEPVPALQDIEPLIEAYSRWGVHYVIFFDCPNSRHSWRATTWAQTDLVERFLDRFIPYAELSIKCGLRPVFPPLEPGGDYWDTAFLRGALQGLLRRDKRDVIDQLVLGAYAPSGERALDWGAGGPERWPGARPYYTPAQDQDQRGVCIFDWYLALSQAVLGKSLPMILFGMGSPGMIANTNLNSRMQIQSSVDHAQRETILLQYVLGKPQLLFVDPLPLNIIACNFWLLSAAEGDPHVSQSWFRLDGQTSPIVGILRQWQSNNAQEPFSNKPIQLEQEDQLADPLPEEIQESVKSVYGEKSNPSLQGKNHPISHYLLLPTDENGNIDIQIEHIYPFVKKHNLTVGFSLEEAALSDQITILDNGHCYSTQLIDSLRASGSKVVILSGSGTELAYFLSAL